MGLVNQNGPQCVVISGTHQEYLNYIASERIAMKDCLRLADDRQLKGLRSGIPIVRVGTWNTHVMASKMAGKTVT